MPLWLMRPAGSPDTGVVCEMHPELFELLVDAGFRLKSRLASYPDHRQHTRSSSGPHLAMATNARARVDRFRLISQPVFC